MSRVELAETVWEPQGHLTVHIDGAEVSVLRRSGAQAQLFTTATGSTLREQPLTTRYGRIEPASEPGGDVWIDPGSYDFVVVYGDREWTQKAEIPSARLSDSPAIERIKDWLLAESTDSRNETMPAGWRRALETRKPTGAARLPGTVELYDGQTDAVEDPSGDNGDPEGMIEAANNRRFNTTAAALMLHLFARIASIEPGRQRDLLPHVDRLGRTMIACQHKDPNTLIRGGFKLAPNDTHATAFGTGLIGRAMLAAFKATNNPAYFVSARGAANFLMRLYDPNAHWPAKYAVANPIGTTVWKGLCDRVDNNDKLQTTSSGWNLVGARLLREMADFMGTPGDAYGDAADAIRDFMAYGPLNAFDYYAPPTNLDATYVSATWPLSSSHTFNDDDWHRLGDVAGTGTVGTDQIEYGLPALYALGYDVTAIRAAYEHFRDLPHSGDLHIASENGGGSPDYAFGEGFDGAVCWCGYLRAGGTIADGAFPGGFRPERQYGRYYDAQGAATLGGFKALLYPADFAKSLPILETVIYRGSLLNKDLETNWATAAGYDYATKGIIPIATAGLALLDAIEGLV